MCCPRRAECVPDTTDLEEATMSPRSSRSRRKLMRDPWWEQFRLPGHAGPNELTQLSACADDDEAGGGCDDRPIAAEAVAAAPPPAPRRDESGGWEVPVKLRHLKVAADRGHLEAMYLLAQECDDRMARIHWLTMAAERGHLPAMHDLGLASAALHGAAGGCSAPPGTAGPKPWPSWATWNAPENVGAT